jgi:DNA-binding transcriptional MerR regulator
MRVSDIAKRLNVSADTIRYYTRIKMLNPSTDTNGYRIYSQKELSRLRFILRAKKLGFSLADIQTLMSITDKGGTPCPTSRKIITDNIQVLEQSINESMQLFKQMKEAIHQWDAMPDTSPDGKTVCSLIENWDQERINENE